jgi:hypothetical protein
VIGVASVLVLKGRIANSQKGLRKKYTLGECQAYWLGHIKGYYEAGLLSNAGLEEIKRFVNKLE